MTTNKTILLIEDAKDPAAFKKMQNSFGIKFASSEDLGDKLRAQDVYDEGAGLVFKHLNVAVVEQVDMDRFQQVIHKTPGVIHWEREKVYSISSTFDSISTIKVEMEKTLQRVKMLESALAEKLVIEKNKPSPTARKMTWGLEAIGFSNAVEEGQGVCVAILDTGIYLDHPDFQSKSIKGLSFIADENWSDDPHGHGTHCAGTIIGGKKTMGELHYGIAPQADLLVGKVLNNKGLGTTSGIVDGIDWALEKNARIISLSLGTPVQLGEKPSLIFERIGEKALRKNCLIIAAAGNESRRPVFTPQPVGNPANTKSIIAVAAVDQNLKVANFSNAGLDPSTGGNIDFAAPGTEVLSAASPKENTDELYTRKYGTSMAVPHVTAAAALYCQRYPQLSAQEIWNKLKASVKKIDHQRYRDVGDGLIQISRP
ncbi:MAG: S8 family serine peptidase [Saprospiraceae bacterium]|nr:S8 family serine peptidase [Saprospiraceae bacterium]